MNAIRSNRKTREIINSVTTYILTYPKKNVYSYLIANHE